MTDLHLISLENVPIFTQLELEEALLRTDTRNFCIVNFGSPKAIVMGISGKAEELIHPATLENPPFPILRRFSGGGTVIVDEETLFISFIFSKKEIAVTPFPEPILQWTESLYKNAWQIPGFALRENDYVIHTQKCGGNAQYIQKDRWLHHTSFLWDYNPENMNHLLLPLKRPSYRQNRAHTDFLCPLNTLVPHSIPKLQSLLIQELEKSFSIHRLPPPSNFPAHRKATCKTALHREHHN